MAGLKESVAEKPARLVGRQSECDLIQSALDSPDPQARIFYFIASAGIGKTRLLQEVRELARKSTNSTCFVGMFDMDETALHSNSELERQIFSAAKENLNLTDADFSRYLAARNEFEAKRRQVTTIEEVNKLRRAVGKALIADLNEISKQRNCRLVFCFDTLEALQYESLKIQDIIEPYIRDQVIESRTWLAEYLPQLENAVIVMAGRKKPGLAKYFQESFGSPTEYQSHKLDYLKEDGVKDYFLAMAEKYDALALEAQANGKEELAQNDLDLADQFRWYWENGNHANITVLTRGWPLMLAFMSDLIVKYKQLPDEFVPEYPLDVSDAVRVAALQAEIQTKLYEGVKSALGAANVAALTYIALLRKGATAKLLSLAAQKNNWSEDKCREIIKEVKAFTYAKPKKRKTQDDIVEDVMFLHDQLYDIMDATELVDPSAYKDGLDAVIGCYADEIQALQQQARHENDTSKVGALRHQEFRLLAEKLYYQLLRDPINGYHEYSAVFDRAILNRQLGLDMLVRDEMLRFFEPRLPAKEKGKPPIKNENEELTAERIQRGAAIRWVQRLIASGNYESAIHVARVFKADSDLTRQEDPLFIPILDMWEGEAAAYLGKPDIANPFTILEKAIETFNDKDTIAGLKTEYMEKLHKRNLGRAYNTYGFAFANQNDWDNAVENYSKALPLLRDAGQPHQNADTLKNLAFAQSRKGEYMIAQTMLKRAERICRGKDFGYLLGLCLTSRAAMEIELERPHEARAFAREAHEILQSLREGGEQRGIGIALTGQGRACRRIFKQALYGEDDPKKLYEEGKAALEAALSIFNEKGATPQKLREHMVLNELGSLHRDWANLLRTEGGDSEQIEKLETQAQESLSDALQIARERGDVNGQADTLNDQAELQFNQNALELALDLIAQADQVIEMNYPNYILFSQLELPEKPQTSLYVLLGTNALLRGHIYMQQAFGTQGSLENRSALQEATRNYLLASAYYDKFGGDETAQGVTSKRTHATFEKFPESGYQTSDLKQLSQFIQETLAEWHKNYPSFPQRTRFSDDFEKNYVLIEDDL